MNQGHPAQRLMGALRDMTEALLANDLGMFEACVEGYYDIAGEMVATGMGGIAFQGTLSIAAFSSTVADLIQNGKAPDASIIECILEKLPVDTELAWRILDNYLGLAPNVGAALLKAPYELASASHVAHRSHVHKIIASLAKNSEGRAGAVLSQYLRLMVPDMMGGFTFNLLACVGRLPEREVSQELASALIQHEHAFYERLTCVTPQSTFATPDLMLGVIRSGSRKLFDITFCPSRFNSVELYELSGLTRTPMSLSDDQVAAYLMTPGDTNTFIIALYAGNPHLDLNQLTSLYTNAWVNQGSCRHDNTLKQPLACVPQWIRAFNVLLAIDRVDSDRWATLLETLLEAMSKLASPPVMGSMETKILTRFPSDILLKTTFGQARADAVLAIDMGL